VREGERERIENVSQLRPEHRSGGASLEGVVVAEQHVGHQNLRTRTQHG
jgi:hypothetical protein